MENALSLVLATLVLARQKSAILKLDGRAVHDMTAQFPSNGKVDLKFQILHDQMKMVFQFEKLHQFI
jgi:hypothetical protein